MTTLARVRVVWGGTGVVGGGVSTFYSADSDGAPLAAQLLTYFNAIKGILPPSVNFVVDNGGATIDSDTGELNGSWSGGAGGGGTGTGAGAFAQGVGMRQVWVTTTIHRGRRVRGSTFLVPIGTSNYESDGTLTSGVVTAVQAAAAALVTAAAGNMVIWSRPLGVSPGATAPVTAALTPDKVSWLVSRRR